MKAKRVTLTLSSDRSLRHQFAPLQSELYILSITISYRYSIPTCEHVVNGVFGNSNMQVPGAKETDDDVATGRVAGRGRGPCKGGGMLKETYE